MALEKWKQRAWLNPSRHPDNGFIIATVKDDGWSVDAELVIGDCRKSVTLDFSFDTVAGKRQRISKARAMIRMLEAFIEELQQYEYEVKRPEAKRWGK